MHITSATFVKSAMGTDPILTDGTPQIAFIGRSNVGKSSLLNALVRQKDLAHTSATPGRTRQINVYRINRSLYLIDLPGYGFAKMSKDAREQMQKMVDWYFFRSGYPHKLIVLIIDAAVGPTAIDMEMLYALEAAGKPVAIVANKIDKIKSTAYALQLQNIQQRVGQHLVFPCSAKKGTGIGQLVAEILR